MFAPIPAAAADRTNLISRSGDTLYSLRDQNLSAKFGRMNVYTANPNTGGWDLVNEDYSYRTQRIIDNIADGIWTVVPR
jgi:hypothetical protein